MSPSPRWVLLTRILFRSNEDLGQQAQGHTHRWWSSHYRKAVELTGGQGWTFSDQRHVPPHQKERSMNNPLFVGVDVHRKRNVLAMMNRDGEEVATRLSVANNRPGTRQTIEQLVDLLATSDYDAIQIGESVA